jgi:predicted PurR-regulated permease PerM
VEKPVSGPVDVVHPESADRSADRRLAPDPARPEADPDRWPEPSYWAKVAVAVALVVAGCYAVIQVRDVLVLILVSLVLAIGIQRPIDWLERKGLPRGLAVALMGISILLVIGGFLALVVPSIVKQLSSLAEHGPEYIKRFRHEGWVRHLDSRFHVTKKLTKLAGDLPDKAISLGTGVLSATVSGLTIIVLTSYFSVDLPRLRKTIAGLLVPKHRDRFDRIADQITKRVGGYVNGNLIVSVIAGVITTIAMWIIGVPYAAALGMWVALTDLIPSVGALLGAAAVLVVAGLSGGISTFLIAGAFFLVYQQIENYLIVPRVMKGAINMSIGAVLIAVLLGGELAGFVGVLLALPIAATVQTVLDELYFKERRRSVRVAELREERIQRWAARLGRRPRTVR